MTMDKVIEIETSEDYASWRWYASALQQHHYALLMATEIIMNPRRKESSRIWKGLDYVFEPPPLPPIARARWIITQAWWKMEVYIGKRQLRVPINLEQNLKEALKLSEDKPRGERRSSASTEATSVEDDSAQIAQSQSAKRQGQPAKKRTTSSKDNKNQGGISPTPPKASRGSEGAQVRPPMDKPGTTADQSHTQHSPSIGAPAKQMMDVDWVRIQYAGSLKKKVVKSINAFTGCTEQLLFTGSLYGRPRRPFRHLDRSTSIDPFSDR